MTAVDVTARVTAALAELGDTPDAVADSLRAKGIKGARRAECDCPVANYLRTLDGISEIEVSGTEVFLGPSIDQGIGIEMPVSVAGFVHHFDEGVYLDLVDGGDRR